MPEGAQGTPWNAPTYARGLHLFPRETLSGILEEPAGRERRHGWH